MGVRRSPPLTGSRETPPGGVPRVRRRGLAVPPPPRPTHRSHGARNNPAAPPTTPEPPPAIPHAISP
ncbi:hypothetical protein GCM10010238_54360 [Streptomyces griseoviridis]|uniref:Uncharacterized protein n=1 Tax=Streptomyces griseoviridis TaxID=45398 RepID=A0A918GTT0_STRGD|nr:hypothetical protein GCM10010238_54360 [Streptomyces niveoruber]